MSSSSSLHIGKVIRSYKLVKHIGEGSSGSCFSAKDSNNNKYVVLKFICLKTTWAQKEFERETSSLAKCSDCPLIVKMLHSFTYKTFGVIVLEQLSCDLLNYLQTFQKLDVEFVKTTFFQLCVAVLFLHKRCIAHLDIKPENIFLTTSNSIKLGDFGSSYQWQNDFEYKLGAVGTSYYCAPEVGDSLPYNPRKADAWSLGILLHVLLTGLWPFKASNEILLHDNVATGKVDLFYNKLPKDSAILDLINGLLIVDPSERYSIAEALASDWLVDVKPNYKNRTASAPQIHSYDTIITYDNNDVHEENDIGDTHENDIDDIHFNEFSDEDITNPVSNTFTFSDDELDDTNDNGNSSLSYKADNPLRFPRSRKRELNNNIGSSLPKALEAEPMKKPRTLNMPDSPENAVLAPIKRPKKKDTKKRTRKASLLHFLNTKMGPSRRSSTADANPQIL